jgi:hypothetical protein
MRYLLIVFCCSFANLIYSQNASQVLVGEKKYTQGYLLLYIHYTDSVSDSLNKVGYFFVEDQEFKNSEFKRLHKEFISSKRNKNYQLNRTELTVPNIEKKQYALLRSYGTLLPLIHPNYKKGKNTISAKDAAYIDQHSDNQNDLVSSKFLSVTKPYGTFVNIIKVSISGYVLWFDSFENYEYHFINSSNDKKVERKVGLGVCYASLIDITENNLAKGYPAFLPVKVKKIK